MLSYSSDACWSKSQKKTSSGWACRRRKKETNSFEIASLVTEIWIPRYWEFCAYICADNISNLCPHTHFLIFKKKQFVGFPELILFSDKYKVAHHTVWVGFESHMSISQSFAITETSIGFLPSVFTYNNSSRTW